MEKEKKIRRELETLILSHVGGVPCSIDTANHIDEVICALHRLAIRLFPVDSSTIASYVDECYRAQVLDATILIKEERDEWWHGFYHGAGFRRHDAIREHDNYFAQKVDGVDRLGLSTLQKVTAAFRILAYGASANSTDEYVRIGESTAIERLKRFCREIVEVFGDEYLRSPNTDDVARPLQKGEERGFPGMLGSLDCMHWEWKNCLTAWAGQYSGRHEGPTIILEAVALYDLWIWHAFFGLPGSNNDINVLQASNLFDNLTQGITPPAHYTIQGKNYDVGYYLADGIYLKWPTLVQTISKSEDKKKQYFAMMQEACQKDVERAFGVLQSRFAIIKGPACFWDKRTLHDIMTTCIIMHNMIIEDERDEQEDIVISTPLSISNVEDIGMNDADRFRQFLTRHKKFKDKEAHFALRNALIEHLWERHGNEVM